VKRTPALSLDLAVKLSLYGWREVADKALAFVKRFARADEPERNAAKHEHAGMASDRA
jgi:hypothetical protein